MSNRKNQTGSSQRRLAGQRLADAIDYLGLDPKAVATATGVDPIAVTSLHKKTPHFSTLARVAAYVEKIAKERRDKKKG